MNRSRRWRGAGTTATTRSHGPAISAMPRVRTINQEKGGRMNLNEPSQRQSFLRGALATPVVLAGSALLAPPQAQAKTTAMGPSTTTAPYLAPSIAGAKTVAILPTGDSVNGYRMLGTPDGPG